MFIDVFNKLENFLPVNTRIFHNNSEDYYKTKVMSYFLFCTVNKKEMGLEMQIFHANNNTFRNFIFIL